MSRAPALEGAVRPHAAAVEVAGADGAECPLRGAGLVVVVPAPAVEGAVGADAAAVGAPGADGDEGPGRGRGLPVLVVAPAVDGAVGGEPAGVTIPGVDGGGTRATRGVDLPNASLPQQGVEPSSLMPQLWRLPELTERNSPAGGVACPSSSQSPAGERSRPRAPRRSGAPPS